MSFQDSIRSSVARMKEAVNSSNVPILTTLLRRLWSANGVRNPQTISLAGVGAWVIIAICHGTADTAGGPLMALDARCVLPLTQSLVLTVAGWVLASPLESVPVMGVILSPSRCIELCCGAQI